MSRARAGLSNLATAYPRPVALGAPMVFLFVLGLTLPARAQLGPALAGRTAAAQNAATVNHSPAGIMRLSEFEVVFDGTLAISDNKFDVGGGTTESGGNPDNDVEVAGIPQLAISTPLGDYFEAGDRFAVGLGFSVPTGFGSDYGDDWAERYLAQESSLVFLNIQPVVAARVTDWLSIGAGASIMYVDSSAKLAISLFAGGILLCTSRRSTTLTEEPPMTLSERQEKLCDASPFDFSGLSAIFLNCTLKRSTELSHTEGLLQISKQIMEKNGIATELLRPVDCKPSAEVGHSGAMI